MKHEAQLHHLINEFDEIYDRTIDIVRLDGKTLKDTLVSQLPMQLELEMFVKRINYLHDLIEMDVEEAYAVAIANVIKKSQRELTATQAKDYSKADPEYRVSKRLLLDARKVRDEARGCLEVVNTRRFTLNNMTNSVIAGVEHAYL